MLELEILELLVECFVLADFAHVVFLFKDAHATCDAWREVAAALLATDITIKIKKHRLEVFIKYNV